MQYRREIDGLRALAIIPVILFHANQSWAPGGFIGVDIFFVISGYLITKIILRDLTKGKFSLISFYERRMRRILPNLFFMLLISSIAAWILMSPNELYNFSKSLVSTQFFASNIYFWHSTDYFALDANTNPLLHTWSLAVEEQFYLFFPLFLVVFWRRTAKKTQIYILSAIALISFLISSYLSKEFHSANFFLSPSRIWELLIGSLLAYYYFESNNNKNNQYDCYLSFVGLVFILVPIFIYNETYPFPSVYALAPTLGVALIIAFAKENIIARILGHKYLVGIGLISYSLYLWHFPVLAFLRLKTPIGEPSNELIILFIILIIILSIISYYYVEKPLRVIKKSLKKTYLLSLLFVIFFSSAGIAGYLNNGFPERFSDSFVYDIQESPKRGACHTSGNNFLKPKNACLYPKNNNLISWAVLGDSHMVEPAYALSNKLKESESLVHLTFAGCPPGYIKTKISGCQAWTLEAIDYIKKNKDIANVLIGYRYSYYFFGDHSSSYPKLPEINLAKNLFNNNFSNEQNRSILWNSFKEMIDELLNANKTVYIMYPVPELPGDIRKSIYQFSIFNESDIYNLKKLKISDKYFLARNKLILDNLNTLEWNEKLIAIKPREVLCDYDVCSVIKDGELNYSDDNHLSVKGASRVINLIKNL